jgi:hypothetical protein
MKTTSKVALYTGDPEKLAGVVFYPSKKLSFFPEDTAIQPENPHPIPHADIAQCMARGTFELVGDMPEDFGVLLTAAITASVTIKPARKQHWLERL